MNWPSRILNRLPMWVWVCLGMARRAKTNTSTPTGDQEIVQRWGDVVRLVAWYGAIRYKAGTEGLSSLENPGDPT